MLRLCRTSKYDLWSTRPSSRKNKNEPPQHPFLRVSRWGGLLKAPQTRKNRLKSLLAFDDSYFISGRIFFLCKCFFRLLVAKTRENRKSRIRGCCALVSWLQKTRENRNPEYVGVVLSSRPWVLGMFWGVFRETKYRQLFTQYNNCFWPILAGLPRVFFLLLVRTKYSRNYLELLVVLKCVFFLDSWFLLYLRSRVLSMLVCFIENIMFFRWLWPYAIAKDAHGMEDFHCTNSIIPQKQWPMLYVYGLIQGKRPKFCQPRMNAAGSNIYSNVTFMKYGVTLTTVNNGRWQPVFFSCSGPMIRRALRSCEKVFRPTTGPWKGSLTVRRFRRKKTFFFPFFSPFFLWTTWLWVLQGSL